MVFRRWQNSNIYLDLGVHLFHMIDFLIGKAPLRVCAIHQTNGFFRDIVDDVSCMITYEDNINAQLWFSKTALGYQNGLKIRVFGDKASAEWLQGDAGSLFFHSNKGVSTQIERGSNHTLTDMKRYNRFKAGHPAGFMEAFANYYHDIADSLLLYKQNKDFENPYISYFTDAEKGMNFLQKMAISAQSNQWEKV